MICHPGSIQDHQSDTGYKHWHKGSSESFCKQRCLIVKCRPVQYATRALQ